jgi:hypothetical protein
LSLPPDHGPRSFVAVYLSSVPTEDHPLAMTEYITGYSRAGQTVAVLSTDQMTTVNPVKNADPLDVMLPIIHNVQLLRPR